MADIAFYNNSISNYISHVAMFYKNRIRRIRNDCKNRLTGYKMKRLRKNGKYKKMRKSK